MIKNQYTLLIIVILPLMLAAIWFIKTKTNIQKEFVVAIININKNHLEMQQGFIDGLAGYGYEKNKNIQYKICNDPEKVDSFLEGIGEQQIDLIFTTTTPLTKKVQRAMKGKNIPIVFIMYDPINAGVINSRLKPGTNLTGIQVRGSTPKAFEFLLALKPDMKHLYIPVKYDTKSAILTINEIRKISEKAGIKLTVADMNTPDEMEQKLSTIPDDVDGVFIVRSIFIASQIERIVQEGIRRKLPMSCDTAKFKEGVTISYSLDRYRTGKQLAKIAQKIFLGFSPNDLPTEISDFFLGINLKTANESGLNISYALLSQADFIIR